MVRIYMTQLFDDKGNPVDAFTQEDVNKQVAEKTEEVTQQTNKDKEDAINKAKEEGKAEATKELEGKQPLPEDTGKLKTELDETKNKLKEMEGKDFEWSKLKKEGKEKDQVITETKSRVFDLENALKSKEGETLVETALDKIAAGDDKLREQIKYHYNRLPDQAVAIEEIEKKMRDAYLLARGEQMPKSLDGVVSAAGAGNIQEKTIQSNKPSLTEDQKDLAGRFGITDEDVQKFDK